MNNFYVSGYVSQKCYGKDVHIESTKTGKQFINFCINCPLGRKDENGEWVKINQYFDMTYWLRSDKDWTAKLILGAGKNRVAVKGHLVNRKFKSADGKERQETQLVADEIEGSIGVQSGDSNEPQQEVQEESEIYYDSDCPF